MPSGVISTRCISLSISIREPKPVFFAWQQPGSISLSISIREPKRLALTIRQRPRISLSISIREPKHPAKHTGDIEGISLSISIREPKRGAADVAGGRGISLSISIREPKRMICAVPLVSVSAYQYPSENQNWWGCSGSTPEYQLINIHQRTKTILTRNTFCIKYQLINIHQRTKTAKYGRNCGFGHILSTKIILPAGPCCQGNVRPP